VTCLTCLHWRLKDSGSMGRQGFALCNKGPRWQFNAPTHNCLKHEPAPQATVDKRKEYLG
jgi:hypothetical protein